MRKIQSVIFGAILAVLTPMVGRAVEGTWEYAVQASAVIQTAPPQIKLSWPQDSMNPVTSYTVYRKSLDATSWGSGVTLSGSTTNYVDSNVTVGSAYEYQIVKITSAYTGYGYVYAGINFPVTEARGKVVLLVDNTIAGALSNELARLQQDLVGDGWTVLRHDVSRNDTPPNIKAVIQSDYASDPANVKSVFLFGHIPVPYSGDIVPDGHVPNHRGAWPADVYYGDMDGIWTDNSVNDTAADDARNHNVPGDGKFDQSVIPSTVELMVGRVDLANLPGRQVWNGPATFPSELELLRNYLNKDHKFRNNQMALPRRGIVGDYFGIRNGEAFAASGWRNFSAFFGADNVTSLPTMGTWLPTLSTNGYLWAYGCGAGSYTSIGGIGNFDQYNDGTTIDLMHADVKAVFTLLFGSWLGDWDSEDNIMRTVLASPTYGLTCAWSGRPHWFCQHMALGMPIGYSARLTQNNGSGGLYQNQVNSVAGDTHIALMGDPTLRMHPVSPATSVAANTSSGGVNVSWAASTDSVIGYVVYRAATPAGPFTRLNNSVITGTTFTDLPASSGTYMVRAVKLETSGSGSYYNPSQGAFATVGVATSVVDGSTTTPVTTTNTTPVVTSNAVTTVTSNGNGSLVTNISNLTVWLDDSTPAGANIGTTGGDSWNWVSSNPAPYSGNLAHQSAIAAGLHQQYFTWATATLQPNAGESLVTYVYLDPANVPSEVMLEWYDGTWDHRAYWGANNINNGTDNTVSRQYMGPLPSAGQWVPLIVPASQINLAGSSINSMTFTLYGGKATWDYTAKGTVSVTTNSVVTTNPPPPVTTTNTPPSTNLITVSNMVVWFDDSTPTGAQLGGSGGDSWNWIASNPSPYSGSLAHKSAVAAGLHQHYFTWASATLPVNTGESLLTYVYLDPANLPSEVMLEWYDGTWEHRAYWGANKINNGADGTVGRRYMGPLPATGQWAPLVVPASQVNLEGSTVNSMTFTLFDGSATWDYTGKASGVVTNITTPPPVTNGVPLLPQGISINNGAARMNFTGVPGDQYDVQRSVNFVTWKTLATITAPTNGLISFTDSFSDLGAMPVSAFYRAIISQSSGTNTNSVPPITTNLPPAISSIDDTTLSMPKVGDSALHILSPTILELVMINTKQPDPATVAQWNFVDSNSQFQAPAASEFNVTVNGKSVAVQSIAFKRRPLYAPLSSYDLRIENCLYLTLATPIADNQNVVVQNPDSTLWSSSMQFTNSANPVRFSPAIHVNQEGYVPSMPKKAMIGYYLGSGGEMSVPPSAGFVLVDAITGSQVYGGTLSARPDVGWNYSPAPYQNVLVADFSNFVAPGQYRLVVPGYGASLPFLINDGIAMDFARAYALGLYHQRCGTSNSMPYTRFTHDACHTAPATVPVPESAYAFTWQVIAGYSGGNASQTAPQLTSQATSLFPFVNTGPIDTHGGHHDAGDYSKYTINVAGLVHILMFAADSLQGVSSLDNLGIPESGDGISDVMQEAKWEADYLCRIQDADGGFYFLVYPQNREYESNVTPDHGDPQVVWPKNTSATAASVAALAQCASSPKFKAQYPAEAALYLQKAKLGWQFLTNAIAKYGKNGAYQKITFYSDDYNDADELAWAACEMYLATGDPAIQQTLLAWFNPADPATWRWGWWHMSECYGNAIRSYAFAAKSGRLQANQLDATFLSKCQAEITAAANDAMTWSQQSSYGTSFPQPTKAVNAAGWYFSENPAFDIAVAYQLTPRTDYLDAMVANMNYEGGCNPVNVTYVGGLGSKRQRIMVSQYQLNARHVMPPTGILAGNVQDGFPVIGGYQSELRELCFPSDGASVSPHPFYDRWGDTWNVTTEMITLDIARGMASLAYLSTLTPTKSQAYVAKAGTINVPAQVAAGVPVTATFTPPAGMDMTGARIVWEAMGQEPAFGTNFTFTPTNNGAVWVEAEAQWPDGRRAFASTDASATNGFPTVTVVATDASAVKSTLNPATWTLTRTGDTSAPLTVTFQFTGTATKWNDYYRLPLGDMPEQLTIPAGSTSATLTVYVNPASTLTGSETAILNVTSTGGYNVGSPASGTITLNP